MITRNKLDITFGPFGTSTGLFLFLGGIVAAYFSLLGLLLVLIGSFVWLTTTSVFIDTAKHKVKFSNDLFGIFHTGKWLEIKPGMKLGLKKVHRGYSAYSRGSQSANIHLIDIRVVLYELNNKEVFPLKKTDSIESARVELAELAKLLGVEIIS